MIEQTGDNHWLLNSIRPHESSSPAHWGCFLQSKTKESANLISSALIAISGSPYSHDKLLAELGFGFWRYLFAGGENKQYEVTGKILMKIFPSKPASNPEIHYNQKWVFTQLSAINRFRNRLAHHEPLCFDEFEKKDTNHVRRINKLIDNLLEYMGINTAELFTVLPNRISKICD